MAKRRMFSMDVIDTDFFLEMPVSSQVLYFHFAMRADDDGFVSSPKRIQRLTGCSEDDYKILLTKNFLIPFETGVCVIRHWKVHNYIQKDRYTETIYREEKEKLTVDNNGTYGKVDTECIQDVSRPSTQVREGKVSQGKVREGKDSKEKVEKLIFPDSLSKSVLSSLSDFIEYRKTTKRVKVSQQALNGLLTKIQGFSDQEVKEAVQNSIAGDYQGLFPKSNNKPVKKKVGNENYDLDMGGYQKI